MLKNSLGGQVVALLM